MMIERERPVEPPERRLERLVADASRQNARGNAKDRFMKSLREGGWNQGFARLFGVQEQGGMDEYLDLASDWWDSRHGKAGQKIAESVPPKALSEAKIVWTPGDVEEGLLRVSGGLVGLRFATERVADTKGGRSAWIAYPAGGLIKHPSEEDMENIRAAVVTPPFIEGVTGLMPHEQELLFPWQLPFTKRSMMVLPHGVHDSGKTPYFYAAKGLRFRTGESREYDLVKEHAILTGGKIPDNTDRVDVVFRPDGIKTEVTRIKEMAMGMDFEKTEKEYGMMLLAILRGLRRYAGVDDPVLLGRFDTVKSPAGRQQGFILTRVRGRGMRGDTLINNINASAVGEVLSRSPAKRKVYIDSVQHAVDDTVRMLDDGSFQALFPAGAVPGEYFEAFRKILAYSRGFVEDFRKTESPVELKGLFDVTTQLSTYGVYPSVFGELADGMEGSKLMADWRGDLENVYLLAGLATRIVLEHGMAHEQTYSGNLRYDIEKKALAGLTICDWHDSHDLTEMTYPQAFGYAAYSTKNLLSSARKTQTMGMLKYVKPDFVAAALTGFQMQVPGYMHLAGPLDSGLVASVRKDAMEISPEYRDLGFQTEVEIAFDATRWKPVHEIPTPFFQMLAQVYPPEKHEYLRRNYGR
jgi:hypothetical protein